MTETAKPKPLWWKVGNGKWHECGTSGLEWFAKEIIEGRRFLTALCKLGLGLVCYWTTDRFRGVETRRSAPPVADQCKRCRAAKAKQRKERGT